MVKTRRDNLHHVLTHHQQKVGMEDYGDSRNSYGTIISGNGKSGYNVSFHDMSADHKEVHAKRRNVLPVVDPDKGDKKHDHVKE